MSTSLTRPFPLPKQRVRVPMPVNAAMISADGLVTEPWLYYLMPQPNFLFDQFGFVTSTCTDLVVGEDISIHQPIGLPGMIGFVEAVVKTPPEAGGGSAVLDILQRTDNDDTWHSIFLAGNENKIVLTEGAETVQFFWGTFDPDYQHLAFASQCRLDCLVAGVGVQWETIKVYMLLDPMDSTSIMTPGGPGISDGGSGGSGGSGSGGGAGSLYEFPVALL